MDAFAQEASARCTEWWGPGSKLASDAFIQTWARHKLWINTSFSLLPAVVRKLRQDQAHAILVVPNWERLKWQQQAMKMALADWVLPKGTRLFDLPGRTEPLRGILWEARAI